MHYFIVLQLLFGSWFFACFGATVAADKTTPDILYRCVKRLSPSAELLLPNSTSYNLTRIADNLRYLNEYPLIIVLVQEIRDVVAGVRCATENSVIVNVMNGGHSYEAHGTNDGGILLHLDLFSRLIDMNLEQRYVEVESGMRLGRLYGYVLSYGKGNFVLGAGNGVNVGVTGHVNCGGYGLLGRYVGSASDQVVAVEFVAGDGSVKVANENENSDFFWAFRGACSSAFGIIVSVTFKLTPLASPEITRISLPAITGKSNYIRAFKWFQIYSAFSPKEVCGAESFKNSDLLSLQLYYIGNRETAIKVLAENLIEGLRGILTGDQILNSFHETNFTRMVLDFTRTNSIEELLQTQSLGPISERFHEKGLSYKSFYPFSDATLEAIYDTIAEGRLQYCILKVYGGVNPISSSPSWNSQSPLSRGQLSELHCDYWSPNITFACDSQRRLWQYFALNFTEAKSYPGYIDASLPDAGEAYFGSENKRKLQELRKTHNLKNLASRSSDLLFPITEPFLIIGSRDSSVTVWEIQEGGNLRYKSKVEIEGSVKWMTSTKDGRTLFVINGVSHLDNFNGSIESYGISQNGTLSLKKKVPSGGAFPTYGSMDIFQAHFYVAHLCGNSSLLSVGIPPANVLAENISQILTHPGVFTNNSCNENGPKLEQIIIDFGNGFVVDGGSDKIYMYKYDPVSGKFTTEIPFGSIDLQKGSHPKRLVIHPSKKLGFLLSSRAKTLTVFSYDYINVTLKIRQVISTLEQPSIGNFSAHELIISENGHNLYITNVDLLSSHKSNVAVFSVDVDNSKVTPIQHIYTGGENPEHLAIFEDELYLTNTNSSNIAIFKIKEPSGVLEFERSVSTLPIIRPSFVLPLNVPVA